jgi:predicted  nucleic acid-binding Zn-ribbon protein
LTENESKINRLEDKLFAVDERLKSLQEKLSAVDEKLKSLEEKDGLECFQTILWYF